MYPIFPSSISSIIYPYSLSLSLLQLFYSRYYPLPHTSHPLTPVCLSLAVQNYRTLILLNYTVIYYPPYYFWFIWWSGLGDLIPPDPLYLQYYFSYFICTFLVSLLSPSLFHIHPMLTSYCTPLVLPSRSSISSASVLRLKFF